MVRRYFHLADNATNFMYTKILITLGLATMLPIVCPAADGAADEAASASKHFESRIRPLFAQHCVKCHGPAKQEGGLRLDSAAGLAAGGENGSPVVAGDVDASLLIEAVRRESLEMPPDNALDPQSVRDLEQWVSGGAAWPKQSESIRVGRVISDEDRQWWAFRPFNTAKPPATDDPWALTEIDRFVLARLVEKGLEPAPVADKATRLRRASFGLLGVPPTPDEILSFEEDLAPDAWEKRIDSMLDDPRYGEHWARHWLDVVRYAESDGWNQDAYRASIWRYRDYVVQSFNDDKPYSQFVVEQLAGDELPGDSPEHKIAAGFLRLGIFEYNQRDARGHWDDIMNEMTDVAGDAFLGMGIACARCHDHKFDPILRTDYFQLRAFFEPIEWLDDATLLTAAEQAAYEKSLEPWLAATAEVRAKIEELTTPYDVKKWKSTVAKFPLDIQACFNKPVAERNSWEHQMAYLVSRQFVEEGGGPLKSLSKDDKAKYDELQKELATFAEMKPAPPQPVMTAANFLGAPAPTLVPDTKLPAMKPGFITVLDLPDATATTDESEYRRLHLARWIGRSDNPLTNRVIVNRIWQQHFGAGLVVTPNDFGALGRLPSHPELLDWLTTQFVASGGSLKTIHKLILTSATWQQSVNHPQAEQQEAADPHDELLWRAKVRRLTAEQIRDGMLSVTGELDVKIGGPSVAGDSRRRSIYVKRLRNTPDGFMHAFDTANGLKSVAERNSTTTPTQALLLLNGKYTVARARELGQKLVTRGGDVESNLQWVFRACWGREPSLDEASDAVEFLQTKGTAPIASVDRNLLDDFAHVLFNSNRFLYLD
jgi:mono/diheme cytochrome c family protein